MNADDGKLLVEMRGVTKRFPGVIANDHICLSIRAGEIHTLLGENGAGKSTLIHILSGMLQPDEGTILIDGQAAVLKAPQAALRRGISTVYQHFALVPQLSVLENVVLGAGVSFILDLGQAERRLKAMLGDFGLAIAPEMEVRHLGMGQQQQVEIIKALFRGARLLLLDEPTSVLTPFEVKTLFEILAQFRAKGGAVVLVTHKLDETLALSDRITVLRQGRRVGEVGPAELARPDRDALFRRIVELMFGRQPSPLPAPGPAPAIGRPVCALNRVTVLGDRGGPAVRDVTLHLRAGEIFGLAGVDGNGQKELAEVLAGQRPVAAGRVTLNGTDLTNRGTRAAERAGIGYITDDRWGEGGVPGLSVAENLVLKVIHRPPFSRWTLIDRAALETYARRLIHDFNIKTSGPWAGLRTLSGGNVQKLLLARELALNPKVLVCNQPTQGLDLKTTGSILKMLRAQAAGGTAILLISSELDELLELSDRIGVMYKGRLLDVVERAQAERETIGRLMLGVTR